jgi:hypothetical protein
VGCCEQMGVGSMVVLEYSQQAWMHKPELVSFFMAAMDTIQVMLEHFSWVWKPPGDTDLPGWLWARCGLLTWQSELGTNPALVNIRIAHLPLKAKHVAHLPLSRWHSCLFLLLTHLWTHDKLQACISFPMAVSSQVGPSPEW